MKTENLIKDRILNQLKDVVIPKSEYKRPKMIMRFIYRLWNSFMTPLTYKETTGEYGRFLIK